MELKPKSYRIIRFQDCDPMGHLNNSRYLDYFMNAREDHLAAYYNLNIYARLKETGKSWVVAKNDIIYKDPAWLMEKVLIQTQVNNYSIKHIEVEMVMYNELESKLKALLRTVFIPFDVKTNKAVEHDQKMMTLLKEISIPDITKNIEKRVLELQGML